MNRLLRTILPLTLAVAFSLAVPVVLADTAVQINHDVDAALSQLYASSPAAQRFSRVAKGVLVFPRVIKAGFVVGGQYGVGALRHHGKTAGYYSTIAASYGLQVGAQAFGYALFFMTEDALRYLDNSAGWELGVGPSIVVIDEGVARSLSTTTAKDDIYAFFFSQKGLMAGLGVQGSKITRITPDQ